MTLPTLHHNGTHPESLTAAYEAAWNALDLAVDALRQTAPNGRDYYPQGAGATAAADIDHINRIKALRNVQDELETLVNHCANGY